MRTEQNIRDQFWSRILSAFGLEKPIFEDEFLEGGKPRPMERLGIFVSDSPDLSAYCPRCDDYTPVEVRQDKTGEAAYWRVCCGPIKRINPKRFRVWRVRQEPVLKRFMAEAGIKGTMTEIVPGRIWKLGRRGQQGFIYINRVMIPDLKMFGPVLGRFPGAILVVPSEEHLERLNIVLPNRGIVLREVTWLDESYTIHFNRERIEAIIEPEKPVSDKPVARRGNRAANIEKLTQEVYQHLSAARDCVWETGDLLPRPSLQTLGKMAGLAKHVVTRCMQDPDADKLRYCWNLANDIQRVREWKDR